MEIRTCPAYGCQGGRTSTGMCLICRGQGRVRVKEIDPKVQPGKCPYHSCAGQCNGEGSYQYSGATMYCWIEGPAEDVEAEAEADTGDSIKRMEQFMDLNKELRTAMMEITASQVDNQLLDQMADIGARYQALLDTTTPGDIFIQSNTDAIRQQIAETADWRARALQNVRRDDEAIAEFERAASCFRQVRKHAEAQRCIDKAGEMRLSKTGDLDAELNRLNIKLNDATPGTLPYVELLISLGELHIDVNDDFKATEYLHQAEEELKNLGGYSSDKELLSSLFESIGNINNATHVPGNSPIENAVQHRALTQRLLLALGNAYRTTDPARAAECEERLSNLDSGKDSDMRELMKQFLNADQDVSKFLENFQKKP